MVPMVARDGSYVLERFEHGLHPWVAFVIIPVFGFANAGVSLGNILTQAAGGFTVRLGNDLKQIYDYGPPRIRPSLPGSDYFISNGRIGWYLFAGMEARGVLRNIFLDGNTFRDSISVDKKPIVGDIQAGIAFIIGSTRLAYTHTWRSKVFVTQDDTDQFGAFSLSVAF